MPRIKDRVVAHNYKDAWLLRYHWLHHGASWVSCCSSVGLQLYFELQEKEEKKKESRRQWEHYLHRVRDGRPECNETCSKGAGKCLPLTACCRQKYEGGRSL
eukprot:scaffold36337_cov17-Tisochrysis_lutea.AAC.1